MELRDQFELVRQRVRVDNEAGELWVREGRDAEWIRVATTRLVSQTHATDAGLYITWSVTEWGAKVDLAPSADTPMISAIAWDGTIRWTLAVGELPFFDKEGARGRGLAYVTTREGQILARSGPWFCTLEDEGDRARLGPLQHTTPRH